MINPNIIFLVYDSRSGSTLLAKQIADLMPQVHVTQEIGFDEIIKKNDEKIKKSSMNSILSILYKNNQLRNLNLSSNVIKKIVSQSNSRREIIEKITTEIIINTGEPTQKFILIKNGSHIKLWKHLKLIFKDNISFIHIYRDPRAVFNSKLNTIRPYASYENMAWGGAIVAAWRWVIYSRAMRNARKAGVNVFDISYEDLLEKNQESISNLAKFIGCDIEKNNIKNTYRPPSTEESIHRLVDKDIKKNRIFAWETTLNQTDIIIIDTIAKSEMAQRGYTPKKTYSFANKVSAITSGLIITSYKIFRHFLIKTLTIEK